MRYVKKLRTGVRAVASLLGPPRAAAGGAQALLGHALSRMSVVDRRRHVESKPRLDGELMRDARLFPDRDAMLEVLPNGGIAAEIGSDTGYFSIKMAEAVAPSELHLFDIDFGPLREPDVHAALGGGTLHKHLGDSSTLIGAFPPDTFDLIYLDGDHGYEGVVRDLAAIDHVLKPGGYLMCNDYTVWSPMEGRPYGVARAINEFILSKRYLIRGYAFHFAGHDDILLWKPQDGA